MAEIGPKTTTDTAEATDRAVAKLERGPKYKGGVGGGRRPGPTPRSKR